jgi:uncharacterized membrane protein
VVIITLILLAGGFMKDKGVLVIMLGYWGACFAMFCELDRFFYIMLAWNVLLAALPLFFIKRAEQACKQEKKSRSVLWTILWLFFFPNSVYMLTDFIHVAGDKFKLSVKLQEYAASSSVVYSNDIMVWLKLLIIGFGFVFALLVGLESMYIFEQNMRKKFSKLVQWLGILGAVLLSGIGVYIGRFLRFNSWDIFSNPMKLFDQTFTKMNAFTLQFIIAFTVYVFGSYVLYRVFRRNR